MTGNDLPELVGYMKRAAIDSFMAEQNYKPHFCNEDYYSLWGLVPDSNYSRPDKDGRGGGEPFQFATWGESLAPSFDGIRETIDGHVRPWLILPDGSDCTVPQGKATAAATIFGASAIGGSISDNGAISLANQSIKDVTDSKVSGTFTPPFLDKYYMQLGMVTYGIGAASAILEANYAAQAEIWKAAEKDVFAICTDATEALKAKAGHDSAQFGKITLLIATAVAGAVVTVASAGTAAPAVTALILLSSAATATVSAVEAHATISGSSYTEILASLGEALDTLNTGITEQEDAFNTMMGAAVNTIENELFNFNLDAYNMKNYSGASETFRMLEGADEQIQLDMDRVATALSSAESGLSGPPADNPTPRAAGIGADNGTHAKAQELHTLLARCLTLTRAEYERGQQLFDATVQDYINSEAATTEVITRLAAAEALTEDMNL
jgi:hypothetical protein